jgi:hypothetical protein
MKSSSFRSRQFLGVLKGLNCLPFCICTDWKELDKNVQKHTEQRQETFRIILLNYLYGWLNFGPLAFPSAKPSAPHFLLEDR